MANTLFLTTAATGEQALPELRRERGGVFPVSAAVRRNWDGKLALPTQAVNRTWLTCSETLLCLLHLR